MRVLCMSCVCAYLSSLPPAALSPIPLSHCHFAVAATLHCLKRFWWRWMGYYVRILRLETSRKVEIRRRIAHFLSSQSSLPSLLINGLTREVSRVYRCAKWILNKRKSFLTLSVSINVLSRSSTRNGGLIATCYAQQFNTLHRLQPEFSILLFIILSNITKLDSVLIYNYMCVCTFVIQHIKS